MDRKRRCICSHFPGKRGHGVNLIGNRFRVDVEEGRSVGQRARCGRGVRSAIGGNLLKYIDALALLGFVGTCEGRDFIREPGISVVDGD